MWFLLMSVIIGAVARFSESKLVNTWIDDAADMVGVALIVGLARAIAIPMKSTHFDQLLLSSASQLLEGLSALVFTPVSYLIFLGLSFIITSSSTLATPSMSIMWYDSCLRIGAINSKGRGSGCLNRPHDLFLFLVIEGVKNVFLPTFCSAKSKPVHREGKYKNHQAQHDADEKTPAPMDALSTQHLIFCNDTHQCG